MAPERAGTSDDFPKRLSLALGTANMSGAQLAAAVGIDKSVVSRWLSGQVLPTAYNMARLSAAVAKVHPGFNLTLWSAPREQFEQAIGIKPSEFHRSDFHPHDSPAETVTTASNAVGIVRGEPVRTLGVPAAIVLLLLVGIGAWMVAHTMRPAGLPPPTASPTPSTASVAVLPFVNMSGDPAKEYLGDGIAEEITNALANTARIRVASRTSAFFFKDKRTDIKDIARKLRVGAVLEGSVRQEGSRIRIVAQLINAADGFHLWSASYDRDLSDAIAVQEDIARAIVATVEQKLPGKTAGAAAGRDRPRKTINPEAYMAYLQGLFSNARSGEGDFLRAAELFNKALRLQPDYAEAHATLAITYAHLYFTGERRDTLGPAAEHVSAALRLEPDNPTALLADALVKESQWRWLEADSVLRRLLRQHPDNAGAHHFHAYLYIALDLWEKAAQEERRAADLDPFVPGYRHSFAEALYYLRRYNEALAEYNKVLSLEPNFVLSLGDICTYHALHGHLMKAREILNHQLAPLYGNDPNVIYCASAVAYAEHNGTELRRIAQFDENRYANRMLGAEFVAYPYAFMGEYDKAVGWLEKAYDDRDFGIFCTRDPALPAAMKATPRWHALMQRPAFKEIARVRQQILARDS